MASNIIAAPQTLTSQNLSLAEDIWKMWQSAAPFNELVEKESNLKRSLPQAFPQMEPAAKRSAPAGGQFPPVSMAQMQSNLAQQQLLQQQAVLQQALARGQIPPNFVMPPVTTALNGVPQQINIQNQQAVLAQLEKLQKEQQHIQQQHLQAQQQQHMQQQQQHQFQQHHNLQMQQQLQQMLQQRVAMQGGTLPTIPGIPAQMLQGQQVRPGMQMIDPRQAEQYAALLKMNPQVLQAQQVQLMAQVQAQAQQQAQQAVPVTAQQMMPQMSGRRQTIGPATITPQMVSAIPRMHPRPSPQLIPTSSPMVMIPSSSTTPAAKSPFQIPAVRPPTASSVQKSSPSQAMKGPEDPLFIKFLQQARGLEIQLHSVLGDGMVRLPTITVPTTTSTPNPTPTKD